MININNPILRGTTGQLGKELVFRKVKGKQVISKFPRTPDPAFQTEAQRATRNRFRMASNYAKECMLLPERKEYYWELAKRQKLPNAYTAAIKEFMNNAPKKELVVPHVIPGTFNTKSISYSGTWGKLNTLPIVKLTTNKTHMKFRFIISFLLLIACFTAYGQEKQSHKSKKHNSAVAEKGLIKVSVMYPFAEGKTFNMEYYETKHMPMVAGFLGSNLVRYTIEKGLASGLPNQPLPYMAIGTFYVKSISDYQAAITPNRDAIRGDFANYTNVAPVILVSEVVK